MERNEAGSDRLPEVGILSFDFVIESPPKENSLDELMLQSENLQQEMQRLEAEADQVVSSRPVTTTRRRSRPPTGSLHCNQHTHASIYALMPPSYTHANINIKNTPSRYVYGSIAVFVLNSVGVVVW